MVLYREVQNIRHTWLTVLLLVPLAVVFFGLYQQVVLGRPWGNHPVSDRAFLVMTATICALVVWLLNLKLVTELRPEALFLQFRVLWKPRRIPLDQIESAKAVTYRPIAEYGGWGIRWSFRDSSVAYSAKGNRGLEIILKDGRRVLIGSQHPEELEGAIRGRLAGAVKS